MSRDSRKVEAAEKRLSDLESTVAADQVEHAWPPLSVVVQSRQSLDLLIETARRKGLVDAKDRSWPPRLNLPPELIAGIKSITSTELNSLLARWPFQTAKPLPQP